MLVRLALALAAAAATVPAAVGVAAAAPRTVEWTGSIEAAAITPEEAERAFARPPIDAAAEPVARVDESALRYYAAQHAQARVEAEIRRLRALHPGWEPPTDLHRRGAGGEDQVLWDLYGKDRIDDLKLEIDRRMALQSGWRPSPEMVEKLRRKELRLELVAASDRSDWKAVLGLAERDALLLDGGDLDVIWRVAEATAETGSKDHALELYRLALAGARTPEERVGTVRKALAVLGPTTTAPLLAEDRNGEFEPVRLDLARARIGEALRPEATAAPAAEDLERLALAARRPDATAGDAALLGWAALKRGDATAAYDWFGIARAHGGDAKTTLGAALAAERSGRHDEAIEIAGAGADDAEVGGLYLDLVGTDIAGEAPKTLSAERTKRYVAVIEKLESGDAAQALAWYAWKAHQYEAARAWFVKAMAWRPTAKSAEGHLLALKALGDRAEFERLAADYRDRFADLAPVAGFAVVASGRSAPARRSCTALLAEGGRSAGDELAKAWCLMERQRGEEALVAFASARRGDPRLASEAAYGESLAHLRAGRTDDAVAVAASGDLTAERREEIGRVALAQQAIARFRAEDWRGVIETLDRRRRHTTEPRDLGGLRGWSLHHLGRIDEARDVFARLDAQLSTHDSRTGLAATLPRRLR